MEREIDEQFNYNGITLKVVKAQENYCTGCYFYTKENECDNENRRNITGSCIAFVRKDLKNVIFKKVK